MSMSGIIEQRREGAGELGIADLPPGQSDQRRPDVEPLDWSGANPAGLRFPSRGGSAQQQGNAHRSVEKSLLVDQAAVAVVFAVIRAEGNDGILKLSARLDGGQDLADLVVYQTDIAGIVGSHGGDFIRG